MSAPAEITTSYSLGLSGDHSVNLAGMWNSARPLAFVLNVFRMPASGISTDISCFPTYAQVTNVDYLYFLGKSYEQLKAYPQAISVLQQAIRIKPNYLQAHTTLGVVFYAEQDWQRAAQALSRVIEIKPNDALAHFVLATCLDNLGNAKEATVQYNKFLELDDGSSDARSFQARQRAKTLERRLKR